jgi:hypothetical protein
MRLRFSAEVNVNVKVDSGIEKSVPTNGYLYSRKCLGVTCGEGTLTNKMRRGRERNVSRPCDEPTSG